MRRVKNVEIGQMVLVAEGPNREPSAPWSIGKIEEYGEDANGLFYVVDPLPILSEVSGKRNWEWRGRWRHCWRLTEAEIENNVVDAYSKAELNGWSASRFDSTFGGFLSAKKLFEDE